MYVYICRPAIIDSRTLFQFFRLLHRAEHCGCFWLWGIILGFWDFWVLRAAWRHYDFHLVYGSLEGF